MKKNEEINEVFVNVCAGEVHDAWTVRKRVVCAPSSFARSRDHNP